MITRRQIVAALPFLSACKVQGAPSMSGEFQVVDTFTDCSISPSGRYVAVSLKSSPGFGIITFDRKNRTSVIHTFRTNEINYFESPFIDDDAVILAKVYYPVTGTSKIASISDVATTFDVGSGELYAPFMYHDEVHYFYRSTGSTYARLLRKHSDGLINPPEFPPVQFVSSVFPIDDGILASAVPGSSPFDTIEIDELSNFNRTIFSSDIDASSAWCREAISRLSGRYKMLSVQGISKVRGMYLIAQDGQQRVLMRAKDDEEQKTHLSDWTTCVRIGRNSSDLVVFESRNDGLATEKSFTIGEEKISLREIINQASRKTIEVTDA